MITELSQQQIKQNETLFVKIYTDYVLNNYIGAENLLNYIKSTDFFVAPASTNGHMSCTGGLCQHTLNVYKKLNELLKNVDLQPLGTDCNGIALIALCHDLWKCDSYIEDYKNVKVYKETGTKYDGKGKYEWETQKYFRYEPEIQGFGKGGKSLFIVQNFIKNIPITEASAIRHCMGGYESNMGISENTAPVFSQYPLCAYLHCADTLVTFTE